MSFTYAILYRFTALGRRHMKRTVEQAAEVRRVNEERGFKIHGLYWTQGQYDMLAIVEAPSEQAIVAGLFAVNEAGNIQSETLRAYTEAEMLLALDVGADELMYDPTVELPFPGIA